MNIKAFIQDFIPQMDSPEKIYELFRGLGYPEDKVLDPSYKRKISEFEFAKEEREKVRDIYTIFNDDGKLQIFLIETRSLAIPLVKYLTKRLSDRYLRFLLILSSDYQEYTFVFPEFERVTEGKHKLKITKLIFDRENPYYTDLLTISNLALTGDEENWRDIWHRWKDAFSVQKVTKKFFAEYKTHFDILTESLKENNKGIKQFYDQEKLYAFAQRFLGRLMFLYFLQKKGWLAGDQKFIPHWFEKAKSNGKNFYQNVLEPLFFATLNKKRPGDQSAFGRIPFLNGGLFEKDYEEFIYIPDDTIEKILNFLNSYNFTISEELPLEVEVAVNPEMLGRIFESMLPEYERGKKGTFYTPRPIVHYMCRESLKEYLCTVSNIPRFKILKLVEEEKTKELSINEAKILYEALDKVCVLDPAVGSGAFLVGMMQEIIRLKSHLAQKLSIKITPAQLKREIIKANLYGIDIESEAIEIAKLRLWLSLVVDEELENVEPLPNLDYKLAVGNSLIESFKGKKLLEKEQFQQSLIEDEPQKLITEFRRLKDKLLDEMDPEKKNSIRQKLEDIEWRLIEKGLSSEAELKTKQAIELGAKYSQARIEIPASEKKKMEKLIKEASQASDFLSEIKKTRTKPFFLPQVHFAEVFTEKNGFDIIIANPPYVRTQKLSDIPYRDDLKLHYGYVDDLYVHFTFRALELARPKGVVSFITSDTYLTLSWKERMRELLQNYRIQRIILTPKAFEATVNTAIYIVQKESLSNYNFTFIDAREISGNENEDWEDKLIVFEELKEIESYDTQIPVRLADKEIEVLYNRYADIGQFRVPLELYKKAVKKVFFTPTQKNLKLYEKFMPPLFELYERWWEKIRSSKDIQKNKREIEEYLKTLKPGDITLLGLITEGGQGLATADNGRFLAVLEGTEGAKRIEERLKDFERRWQKKVPQIYETYQKLLREYSRNDALDILRKKYGEKRLGFPRGFIYKIIKEREVFDVMSYLEALKQDIRDIMRKIIIFGGIPESDKDVKDLWKLPKLPEDLKRLDKNLKERVEKEYRKLMDKGRWIAFTRGGEAENIYWSSPDRFINWARDSVKWLSSSPKARWQGYEHFFQEGITYIDVGGAEIKARILSASIYDHTAHSFFPDEKDISPKYLLGILNTSFASYFANEYLNHTMHFELNDIRLFPVIIPTESQRKEIETLVDQAIEIQKRRYGTKEENEKALLWKELQKVQKLINTKVEKIYGI